MSDVLIGVLVGGLIASIAPLVTAAYQHRRWRRESTLKHLRSERRSMERLFAENLRKLSDGIANNSYDTQMIADIAVFMPRVIGDLFEEWMHLQPKDPQAAKNTYLSICVEMKKVLANLDAQIRSEIEA